MFPKMFALRAQQPLQVREAESQDAQPLLEYLETISGESSFLTFGPGEFTLTAEQEAEFLAKSQQASNQIYLLATMGERIVGSIYFAAGHRPRLQHTGEFGMSVLQEFWGMGIGRRLLESLLDWARENPMVTKIALRVRTDNVRAISLYRHLGFEQEGVIRRQFKVDGVYHDVFYMGLLL